jgi:hypothetical protein
VIALCATAGSAFAKIGESYGQVLQEARQDKDAVAITPWDYDGKPALRVQYRNTDVIHHMFSTQGREIGFYWYANHEVTWKEVAVIQRVFKTKWHRTQITPHWTTWESLDGMVLGVQSNALHILQLNAIEQLPAVATNEAGLHRLRTAQEDSAIDRFLDSPLPAATQASPVASKPTPTNRNDCLVVATEAYARLQKSAYWAKIAGFTWFENANEVGGHAVVFYQPTANSNIWMYDKSGSYEIHTESHELDEIIGALNASLGGSTIRIESPRWLESGGKDKEFTSADRQPAWSSVTKSASQRTNEQTGSGAQAVVAIGFAIAVGVGLRYAGIRLWPLYIVAGPVYNLIEYFRSYRRIARLKRINAAMLDRWANGEIAPAEEQLFDDYFGVPLEETRAHTQARWDHHDFTLKEKERIRSQQR